MLVNLFLPGALTGEIAKTKASKKKSSSSGAPGRPAVGAKRLPAALPLYANTVNAARRDTPLAGESDRMIPIFRQTSPSRHQAAPRSGLKSLTGQPVIWIASAWIASVLIAYGPHGSARLTRRYPNRPATERSRMRNSSMPSSREQTA
jgi:hypothetical protein